MVKKIMICLTLFALFPTTIWSANQNIAHEKTKDPNFLYTMKDKIEGEITPDIPYKPQGEIPPEMLARNLKRRNPLYVITIEDVLKRQLDKHDIVLIDIRNSNEFERFRVPGSINIPPYAIKTKTFLKTKSLILCNEGYSYSQLEQACNSLRNDGYQAWILQGGLSSWKQKEGPLEGDFFAQKELNKIPPQDFFAEKNYDTWIIIDASESKKSEANQLIPQAIPIPYSRDSGIFISRFKTEVGKHSSNPLLSILICNEDGESENMEPLIYKAGIQNCFYLKDGLKGYKKFLQQQALILRQKNKTEKRVSKCPTCP